MYVCMTTPRLPTKNRSGPPPPARPNRAVPQVANAVTTNSLSASCRGGSRRSSCLRETGNRKLKRGQCIYCWAQGCKYSRYNDGDDELIGPFLNHVCISTLSFCLIASSCTNYICQWPILSRRNSRPFVENRTSAKTRSRDSINSSPGATLYTVRH